MTVNDPVRDGNVTERAAEISHSISTGPWVLLPCPALLSYQKQGSPKWRQQFWALSSCPAQLTNTSNAWGGPILLPCACSLPYSVQLAWKPSLSHQGSVPWCLGSLLAAGGRRAARFCSSGLPALPAVPRVTAMSAAARAGTAACSLSLASPSRQKG